MLQKLSALLFLFAVCMWAADFWVTKPFTDWNDQEAIKVLTHSPWVGKITISWPQPPGGKGCGVFDAGRGVGVLGRDGQDGSGGLPPCWGELPGKDTERDDARAVTGTMPYLARDATVTLLWQTALPVKQALVRHPFIWVAGTIPGAKAFPDSQEQFYVLTLSGLPGILLAATQADKKAGLLDITTLTAGGKPPLKAADVQVRSKLGGPVGTVSFVFPKTTTFTAGDKDLEFSTKFDKTALKHKFKLKDMVFHGKVEM